MSQVIYAAPPKLKGNKIRILANCLATGKHLEEGKLYAVPKDITAEDAEELIRIGRAESVSGN